MSGEDQEDHLSEAEFEAAEDQMDHVTYEATTHDHSAQGFARWQRQDARRARVASLAAVVFAVVVLTLILNHSGAAPRPSCSPNSSGCNRTSDGYWIPHWYFAALVAAQGTPKGQRPLSTGSQPSVYQLYAVHATSGEIQEALKWETRIARGEHQGPTLARAPGPPLRVRCAGVMPYPGRDFPQLSAGIDLLHRGSSTQGTAGARLGGGVPGRSVA